MNEHGFIRVQWKNHRRRKEKENDRQKFGHMVNRNLYNLKFMTSFLRFNLYSWILNLE